MSTLNRRGDALHRLGSWLFGEDVAGSKFHSRSLATHVTAGSLLPALANRGGTSPVRIEGLRSMSLLQPSKDRSPPHYVGLVGLR